MIKISLETGSASRFTAKLHQKQRMVIHAGKEAVYEAGRIVYDDSQTRVPFSTGALWASGAIARDDLDYVGRTVIGYGDNTLNPSSGKTTASYAEDVEEKHKFLENALLDNATQVGELLRNRVMQEFQS